MLACSPPFANLCVHSWALMRAVLRPSVLCLHHEGAGLKRRRKSKEESARLNLPTPCALRVSNLVCLTLPECRRKFKEETAWLKQPTPVLLGFSNLLCLALSQRRRKFKEETARLNQQLKSASVGSKGNEKEAERLKKEIDKLRWGGRGLKGDGRDVQEGQA